MTGRRWRKRKNAMILDLSDKMGKKLTTRRRTKSQAPQLAPFSPTIHLLLGPGGCKKKKKKLKSEIEEEKKMKHKISEPGDFLQ